MRSFVTCFALTITAASFVAAQNPVKILDYGSFRGVSDSRTGTDNFLGVPFALAGRLQNPQVIGAENSISGIYDATKYGPACPQQQLIASPLNGGNAQVGSLLALVEHLTIQNLTNQAEECLNINVQVPKGLKAGAKLPVMMWIHGGGFELGSSAAVGSEQTSLPGIVYQGANIVARSVEMDQPVVFVSANHRLNAFGTLASKETKEAGIGNLLLKDQRVAMEWVQKYIAAFGGDPEQVMIFGESAGSIAIAIHMLLNDGNPDGLFNSAIMLSGGVSKFDDFNRGQATFDAVMKSIGCGDSGDKISCFKKADYQKIYAAVQEQPNFLSYESTLVPWYPRPDGDFLKDSPEALLRTGKVANIPYIIGDMKDEGTLFSLINQLNVTTEADFKEYFQTVYFPHASSELIDGLAGQYPADPSQGSPFDTGILNTLGPQYKRLAATIGDYTFQAPRRDLLSYTANKQPAWSYQIEDSVPVLGQVPLLNGLHLADLPILGSFHISDVVLFAFAEVPATISKNTLNIMSTFISFANTHDPNNHGLKDLPYWPKWDSDKKAMFRYKEDGPDIITDNYREEAMNYINAHPQDFRS